jgi:hypothetical protein
MMEIKSAFRRKDGTYVVDNYHVCSKDVDPYGKYDIAEVEAYLAEHPEALVPEPKPPEPSVQEKAAMKALSDEASEVALDMAWLRQQRLKG